MANSDEAERAASEQYLREVFKKDIAAPDDADDSELGDSSRRNTGAKRTQLLNEHLADQDFERLGNLLAK